MVYVNKNLKKLGVWLASREPRMSEYWVSKKNYFCKYCDIFIRDDAPSRKQHETGLRHQGNRDRFIRGLYKEGERRKKDAEEEKREMARIELVRYDSEFLFKLIFIRLPMPHSPKIWVRDMQEGLDQRPLLQLQLLRLENRLPSPRIHTQTIRQLHSWVTKTRISN